MRRLPALLACLLLGTGLLACGEPSSNPAAPTLSAGQSSSTTTTTTQPKFDRDNDQDNNDDDAYVLGFGHIADAADGHAIATLVRRYFAAAASEDGATACSLITPFFAETVVEQYGHTPALRGNTCSAVMTKLFKQNHKELLEKNANLEIMRIGVEGNVSRVGLEFPELHTIRQIRMRRQGTRWTVLDLLDHLIE